MKFLDSKLIGERIRTARFLAKLTLKELSQKTGIGYATISRIERGKKIVNIEELIKICQFTKKPISYFIQSGNSAIEYFYPPHYKIK